MDKITSWTCEPLPYDVARRIERMASDDDVVRVAVMPDVHLAAEYCVGTVVATKSRIFPHAIGGDIGCGMLAIRANGDADLLDNQSGETLLAMLQRFVPTIRHSRDTVVDGLPATIQSRTLSNSRLEKMIKREGRFQLGTLGRGNHFLEFQRDETGALWLMLHTGSRAMGQAINAMHLPLAEKDGGLPFFRDDSDRGQNYLNDVAWAAHYASANRRAILRVVEQILDTMFGVDFDDGTLVETDHNHLRRESLGDTSVWVHRKGAQSAADGVPAIVPGSMGTFSYHVEGRGCESAIHSSSHGAGRRLTRTAARQQTTTREVRRQLRDVIFDRRMEHAMKEEAPSAYRDIRRVMKAQKELVKITRKLTPILSYKGG